MATTLFLAGCRFEIWQGEVSTESGDLLFDDTFFSEAECRAITAEKYNTLSTDGRKKMTYSSGGWVEETPSNYRCFLKHEFGL